MSPGRLAAMLPLARRNTTVLPLARYTTTVLLALLLLAPPVTLSGPVAPLGGSLLGAAAAEEPLPKWGFYVYMAGDNSLSEEAADDLLEMQAAGSNSDREVVALVDQSGDSDSRAYRVLRDSLEETPLADVSSGWGDELDMGDPATLRDFMTWATSEYPAQERILVIWNHGNGFKRVAEDKGSYLTVPEIEGALAEYRSATGHGPLTLIGFDACLMGMFEIAYELREHAAYIHGSEAYEPQEGWTYNHLLPLLGAETSREAMLEAVVHTYVESYRNGSVPSGYSVTASVIDTALLEPLNAAISNFGAELRAVQTLYRDEVDEARANAQVFENNYYRDLYDLTLHAAVEVPSPAVRLAGERVRQAQANATVVEDHWTMPGRRDVSNAHGLTIYYPASTPSSRYFDLAAAEGGGWRAFIDALNSELPQPHASLGANASADGANLTLAGSFSGDAARLELFLQDADGNIVAHEEHALDGDGSGGALPAVTLRPARSGSYRLDALLYDDDGWLQDHYITEELVVDLQLPDIVVEIAGPVIGFPNGQWVIAGTLSEGHTFSLGGTISNQGTVTATNIQLVVTDGGGTWQFQWPELTPGNSTEWLTPWELSNLAAGNYTVSAIATTNTASDEDPASNMDNYMLQIVPPGLHSYQITSNHVNITQFEEGDFSPTVVNITLDGDTGQGVAFVELLLDYPVAWSLQDTSSYLTGADGNVFRYGIHPENSQYTALLVPAGTASLLASFLPSLSSVAGPHEVGISLIDHNNSSAGSSTFTVNVPQYHGLRLSAAEQDNGDWVLFVENSGNGQETVMLTKNLPEGLTLHLSESYMQLAPFETREVRLSGIAGVEGSYSVSFSAQSQLQPEVQVNLTFELSVGGEANSSWIPALLLGLAGASVVAWAVTRRQLL
ncbi:MAG: hypothetical protein BEU05_02690 [Marine Group III euryarchaeote CG-Bathy2]|uniref:Ig-like domain-containing protein n=1 Tax=Marine Group III euryarchaeote CG-Bathy2 TaxID=1889002 RepID=A0A1J5TB86_9ARCH|nr:MAG: hypothetical protein BEU05_02690 [Marine Group III euryarchaeote CG-Bathy2]